MFRSKLPEMLARQIGKTGRIITQKELAQIAGVREATVSTWMNDKPMSHIKAETVEALAKALDCNIWELVELVPSEGVDESPEMQTKPAAVLLEMTA